MQHVPPTSESEDLQGSEHSPTQSSGRTWSKPQVRRVILTDTGGEPDRPQGTQEAGNVGEGYRPMS